MNKRTAKYWIDPITHMEWLYDAFVPCDMNACDGEVEDLLFEWRMPSISDIVTLTAQGLLRQEVPCIDAHASYWLSTFAGEKANWAIRFEQRQHNVCDILDFYVSARVNPKSLILVRNGSR